MELQDFFMAHPRVAIAFSGGVDSAYLLYAAVHSGADAAAYYVQSEFQPKAELEEAQRLAQQLGVQMQILHVSVLGSPAVRENPENRCYHCKSLMLQTILDAAARDGYDLLLDGTNASDAAADRPGMQALRERNVVSPLRLCGLTKDDIRARSRAAGLDTWDKPAYACLATRIPTGERITAEKLAATEVAETCLAALGFRDFRVRLFHGAAKLQLPAAQMETLLARRAELIPILKQYYTAVLLDLEERT